MTMKRTFAAFILVELLAAVAIIALLASLPRPGATRLWGNIEVLTRIRL
jgi:type II secretory pathway pseudopilin PulG